VRKQNKPPFGTNPLATVKRPKKEIAATVTESAIGRLAKPPRKPAAITATEPVGPVQTPARNERGMAAKITETTRVTTIPAGKAATKAGGRKAKRKGQ